MGWTLGRLGRYEEGIEWLHRVVREDAMDDVAHAVFGEFLLRVGRPEEALPALERALVLDPDDSTVQALRDTARAALEGR